MIFTSNLPTATPLNAFNNNVVEFTESSLSLPKYAIITTPIAEFEIQAIPAIGVYNFYFNFIEVFKNIINDDLFSDTLYPYGDNVNQWPYLWKSVPVTYETYNTSDVLIDTQTFTYQILKSVVQVGQDYSNQIWMHDTDDNGDVIFDVFSGYPFDFTIFLNSNFNSQILISGSGGSLTKGVVSSKTTRMSLINLTGQLNHQITPSNKLVLTQNQRATIELSGISEFAYIDYHEVCDGIYLKWFNTRGAWDYWLFTKKYKISESDTLLGSVNSNFDNINNVNSFTSSLGKQYTISKSISEPFLNKRQFDKIKGVLSSPKVYVWMGGKFIECNVDSKLKYTSYTTGNIDFDIKIPNRITQTI